MSEAADPGQYLLDTAPPPADGSEPFGQCPSCDAPTLSGARYCEACGAELPDTRPPTSAGVASPGVTSPAVTCWSCGVDAVDAEGYCERCGVRQPGPAAEGNPDHAEFDLGPVAGVTDRGRHHPVNEDAMAIAAFGGSVLGVVCDGVSTTPGSAVAARSAADAALVVLQDAMAAPDADLPLAMAEAVRAAQRAVRVAPVPDPANPPACTLVAAVAGGGGVTVGWLGDSRAYWLAAEEDVRLTTDDSWAAESVAAGLMTERDANADPRAHQITRWVGADAPDGAANVVEFSPPGPGRLVVCSDGLWNYASDSECLAQQVSGLDEGASSIDVARFLCDFALEAGGHDNITVIVATIGGVDGEFVQR